MTQTKERKLDYVQHLLLILSSYVTEKFYPHYNDQFVTIYTNVIFVCYENWIENLGLNKVCAKRHNTLRNSALPVWDYSNRWSSKYHKDMQLLPQNFWGCFINIINYMCLL